MFWIAFVLTFIFVRLLFPCKVIGKNNIKQGGAIFVCNHLSNLDPVYIIEYLPYRKHYFLAKKELFNKKIKGKFIKSIGGIPIDRSKPDITAIKESLKVLNKGKKLVIFPEGTRNKQDETLKEIKSGSAMLAIKAKVPIIPLHIEKRGKIFRRNKLIVGKPFELNEFYGEKVSSEVLEKASEIISQKLLEIQK